MTIFHAPIENETSHTCANLCITIVFVKMPATLSSNFAIG